MQIEATLNKILSPFGWLLSIIGKTMATSTDRNVDKYEKLYTFVVIVKRYNYRKADHMSS